MSQAIDEGFLASLRQSTRYETFALLPDGTTAGVALELALANAIREGGNDFSALAEANGREEAVYAWRATDPAGETVAFFGVLFPQDHQEGARFHLRQTAVGILVLAALGSVVLAWVLSRVLIVPLERIARAARSIASGQEQAIPQVGGGDELEDLSRSLSTMLAVLSDQASQLSHLNRTKDELVNVVSHELRTPLTSVLAFAELLLTRQLTPEKTRKYVETIHQEATRLANLVNDFLDVRRIEAERLVLRPEPLNLPAIAQEVVQMAAIATERHSFAVEAPPDIPPVSADEERVRQVLTNLVSNAVKYSPAGGLVTVSLSRDNGTVRTAVRDEGLGVPADAIGRLFDKFSRLNLADRRGIPGTGLGLALSKELVERHGGRVWVESVFGKGSTFFFTLPVAPGAVAPAKPAVSVRGDSQ